MRIGFLLDDFAIAAWAYEAIESVLKLENVTPCLLIIKQKNNVSNHTKTKLQKILSGELNKDTINNFLYYRYAEWDKKRYIKPENDAHMLRDARTLFPTLPLITVNPRKTRHCDWIEADDLEEIKKFQPDMLFRVGFRILKGEILNIPTYGVWSYHHGDPEKYRGGPSGFWETYYNEGVVGAVLQRLTENLDAGEMLAKVITPASNESPAISRNNIAWDSVPLLHLCIKKLLTNGNPCLKPKEKILANGHIYYTPGLLSTFLMALKFIYRKITNPSRFFIQHWSIHILHNDGTTKLLKQPKGKFWADPFLSCINNKDYIFFEECDYKINKGVIKVAEVSKNGLANAPITILENKFHFSNPYVFVEDGLIYLLPEQAEGNEISLYRCIKFPDQWKKTITILKGGYYVDPILLKKNNKWWLFFVEKMSSKGSTYTFAKLCFAESLNGPWQEHPCNPISSNCRYSRSGGSIIQENNQIIRVVQDCSRGYGYKINYLKITQLSESEYSEELIHSINPENLGADGIHTINSCRDLIAIDSRKKTLRLLVT